MTGIVDKPKHTIDFEISRKQLTQDVDVDQLCERIISMTLNKIPYIDMVEADIGIRFRIRDRSFRVYIIDDLFFRILNVLNTLRPDSITFEGRFANKISADCNQMVQTPTVALYSQCSSENFSILLSCLKSNHLLKHLTVGTLSKKNEEDLIHFLMHDCNLTSLCFSQLVTANMIATAIIYSTSLKKLAFIGRNSQFVQLWCALEDNTNLQELVLNKPYNVATIPDELVEALANLEKNRVLQNVIFQGLNMEMDTEEDPHRKLRQLLKRNRSYTDITSKEEDKPAVRVLDGFTMTQLEEWMESENAKDVMVLIITRMAADHCCFFSPYV